MKGICALHKAAWVLVIVGGLNWGLVGLADYDLVASLLGAVPGLARAVYILVGVSALAMLAAGKCCMKGGMCGGCGKEGCVCTPGKGGEAEKPAEPAK
jgi:uncharacterized membrane protein YuzA (DUF378 family)